MTTARIILLFVVFADTLAVPVAILQGRVWWMQVINWGIVVVLAWVCSPMLGRFMDGVVVRIPASWR